MEARVTATKLLVLVGIALSVATFPAQKLGIGQLYPFFHWHLFAEPAGWDGARTYRIYWKDSSGAWHRHSPKTYPHYTKKDQNYLLKSLTKAAVKDTFRRTRDRRRLRAFVQDIIPSARSYRVVAESFQPLALLEDTTRYDTTTVVRIRK